MSVATLGLEVTSSPVARASVELDKLTAASAKAEAAAEKLGTASRSSGVDLSKLEASVEKANATLAQLATLSEKTNATLEKIAAGSARASQTVARSTTALNDNARALKATSDAAQLTANQMLNLSRQGNDVITMWALGAQPMQIFASQAGQIYGALQEGPGGVRGSLKALGLELVTLAARFPVATAAIAAAGVGIAAYKLIGGSSVRDLDEILKEHEDIIDRLGPGWEKAKGAAQNYARESGNVINMSLKAAGKDAAATLAAEIKSAVDNIEVAMFQESSRSTLPGLTVGTGRFAPFTEMIERLRDGQIPVLEFRAAIVQLAETRPELAEVAQELLKLTKTAADVQIAISGMTSETSAAELTFTALQDAIVRIDSAPIQKQLQELADKVKDGSASFAEIKARLIELERQNPSFATAIKGLRELAWAAWEAGEGLRVASDRYASLGTGGPQNPRRRPIVDLPDNAPVPERRPSAEDVLAAQEKAAARADKRDPYKEVLRSAEARIRQLDLELSLTGQVGSAADTLRIHQELLNRAMSDGVAIGEKQSEELRQRAATIAQLTEALKRAKLAEDLTFERQQLFRSSEDQGIAARLRGTGLGLDSGEADYLRQSNRISDYRSLGIDLLSGIRDGALSGSGDVGKSIMEGIANAATNYTTRITDRLIENTVTSGLKLLGLEDGGLDSSTVSSMQVQAGNVVVNGSVAGDAISRLFNPANGNDPWGGLRSDTAGAPVEAVTRAPLTSAREAIKVIESAGSGGYSAIGPTHPTMGRALGAYQVMEANVGPWSKAALGESLTASQFLASPKAQDAVFDKIFGGYIDRYGMRGASQAWFGGEGSVGKLGRKDVLGTSVGGYSDKFMAQLDRFGAKTEATGASLDKVTTASVGTANGLGGFGNALMKIVSGVSGGPGWSLSNLFGTGLSNIGSTFMDGRGGGFAGLLGYANGTESAPGGWAWVGEQGPELMRLRPGDAIRSNAASQQMAGAASRPQFKSETHIHNNAGVEITKEDSDDGQGGIRTDIYIDRLVAKKAATSGSGIDKALRSRGAQMSRPRR